MRIIKVIISSISMYSRIPVPGIFCDEDDMGHIISVLPLIGAVIGALSQLLFIILLYFDIPVIGITLILMLVPLIITGGFHVDGFMDVQDAVNSGQERTRKLEIMKDPHIGAFAVISLVITGISWAAFLYILLFLAIRNKDYSSVYIYFTSFFIVRSFCGLSSLSFKKARKNGML
ncbi:MAG: adenosylcobinamide-GDP ribazoletransferase, partial [Lachnospiraceae bacterium]|nr:adenosylcobinamide-GDP ribazoletransferase [Lachnospiraceae bacterium]